MQRAFIVKMDLDPDDDVAIIERELLDIITHDFPEVISVKAWNGEAEGTPTQAPVPIEGEIMAGQMLPPQPQLSDPFR